MTTNPARQTVGWFAAKEVVNLAWQHLFLEKLVSQQEGYLFPKGRDKLEQICKEIDIEIMRFVSD